MVVNYKPKPAKPDANLRRGKLDKARRMVAIITAAYFVTLIGMVIYLSSPRTTLLTPHDPRLWFSAKCAFFAVSGAWSVGYVKTVWDNAWSAWRVVASLLPRWLFVAFGSAAMMGLWTYLAANVYVTAKTWSGHVEHGAVLMVIEGPMITHRGRPTVEAHLMDRPGRSVFFTIDEADAERLRHWHDPGYIDEPACLTVPVQWSGHAIRAEVTMNTPLPKGSLSRCS